MEKYLYFVDQVKCSTQPGSERSCERKKQRGSILDGTKLGPVEEECMNERKKVKGKEKHKIFSSMYKKIGKKILSFDHARKTNCNALLLVDCVPSLYKNIQAAQAPVRPTTTRREPATPAEAPDTTTVEGKEAPDEPVAEVVGRMEPVPTTAADDDWATTRVDLANVVAEVLVLVVLAAVEEDDDDFLVEDGTAAAEEELDETATADDELLLVVAGAMLLLDVVVCDVVRHGVSEEDDEDEEDEDGEETGTGTEDAEEDELHCTVEVLVAVM